MIRWSYAVEYYEENKLKIDAEETRKWLEDHKHMINWEDFEEWAEEVRGRKGYEWLDEILEFWE